MAKSLSDISFATSGADFTLIDKIVDRALAMALKHGQRMDRMTVQMDITACHCNGNPLRLQALLDADDFNFGHDVFGIERHLNRNTGELENCFSPRFSAPVSVAA